VDERTVEARQRVERTLGEARVTGQPSRHGEGDIVSLRSRAGSLGGPVLLLARFSVDLGDRLLYQVLCSCLLARPFLSLTSRVSFAQRSSNANKTSTKGSVEGAWGRSFGRYRKTGGGVVRR